MTQRTEASAEFRWKITMSHGGQYSYGTGWTQLSSYMFDCYRRGVCFRVELKDLGEPDEFDTWKRSSADLLDRLRKDSADRAEGLADVVLDEEGS